MRSLLLLLASSVAGCATARVSPGDSVELEPNQGLLAIGAGEGVHIRVMRLVNRSDPSEEIIISELGPHELALLALPATTFCLVEIQTTHVAYAPRDARRSQYCFDVRDRHLGYGGHIEVQELQWIRLTHSPSEACRALKRDYARAIAAVSTHGIDLESCR